MIMNNNANNYPIIVTFLCLMVNANKFYLTFILTFDVLMILSNNTNNHL